MLEPFDLPGMVLVHGNDARLGISHSSHSNASDVKLGYISESSGSAFKQGASFTLRDGISKYDPISFVAKGIKVQKLCFATTAQH
ncbi:hypothetical protein ACET3Z_001728 [Daucus carota]